MRILILPLTVLAFAATDARAQLVPGPGKAQAAPSISIKSCEVVARRDATKKKDCAEVAARLCGPAGFCELPIGMMLTDGNDLDPGNIKLVRVSYMCGERPGRTVGPYDQNDHATITLTCKAPG